MSAQVTDANGNQSTVATQTVTVAETGPTVTIAAVEGNNVINAAEASAGVPLSGTVTGLAANSTFQVTVTDNGVTKSYTATVNAAGTAWTATIPASGCDRAGQWHRDGFGAGERCQRQPVDGRDPDHDRGREPHDNHGGAHDSATGAVTDTASATTLTASGSLSVSDANLAAVHTVSVTPQLGDLGTLTATISHDTTGTGTGQVVWNYQVSEAIAAQLAAGQTKTDTFAVTLLDGYGNTATQSVTVTITGTNESPVITVGSTNSATGAVTSNLTATTLATAGTLSFSDVDLTDTHTTSVTPQSGDLGSLTASVTHDSTGTGAGGVITWNYQVNEAAVAALPFGQTHLDTFTVTVADNNGGTATEAVVVSDINTVGTFTEIWSNALGGNWSVLSNWASGRLPVAADTVLLNLPTGETVTYNSGSTTVAGILIEGGGALAVSGGALAVSGQLLVTNGALDLNSGGTIQQATITNNGGSVVGSGGTLDGVTYQGTLDLSASSASVFVKDGFTGGVGGATINLTGSASNLRFEGTQTASNATINIGNNSGFATLFNWDTAGAATVTLGTSLTINQVGTDVQLDTSENGNTASGLINAGTIAAGLSGGTFNILGSGFFTNQGAVNVSNGDTLSITASNWSNTGTISVTGGTLNLGGSLTSSQLGTLTHTGGTVNVTGTLDNTGATLNLGTGTGPGTLTLASGGTIKNGTIAASGIGIVGSGGTLDGVTYQGTLDLSASSASVFVKDGFTGGVGGATINLTGSASNLRFEGTQTASNATINIGNNSGFATLFNWDTAGAATVTLGTSLTINQVGTDVQLDTSENGNTASGLINAGTIAAGLSGGTFNILGSGFFTNQGAVNVSNGDTLSITASNWSNTGTISVTGGTLNLGGSLTSSQLGTLTHTGGTVNVTGTLDNTGATLNLGTGTGPGTLTLASGGTIKNGTIAASGIGIVGSGGTLDGVTYQGTLDLSASSASVFVKDGFTGGVGGATINLTGSASNLRFEGTQTASNATINIGNNSGFATLFNWDTAGAATVTLGTSLTINQVGTDVQLDTSENGNTASGLINAGTIAAGLSGGTFNILGSGFFTNQGAVNVSNGDTLSITASNWSNTGTISVTGGTLNLGGSLTSSQLGTLTHTGGTVNVTGTLDNTGATLNLGTGTGPGTLTLASGGTIKNGTIAASGIGIVGSGGTLDGVTYQGTLDLSASSASVFVKDGFTGGVGGATINLTGSASNLRFEGTQTASNATINIGNNSGFATLFNWDTAGAATVTLGTSLTINQVGTDVQLDTSENGNTASGLINAGTIAAGLSGGTFNILGSGFFTNQGAVNVSNGDTLSITASSWSNTGTISANGGNIVVVVAETGGGSAVISGTSQIEYNLASNDNLTFAGGSTGELLLLKSALFAGTITGFTGSSTGTPATSDKLDLRDINFASAQFAKSYVNNVLTVTDGTHTANINMVGTYTLANFDFASDGNGGTLVTELVLSTAPPAVTIGLANDTGSSSTDSITSDDTLTGSGDANTVVHFAIDGTPIATTVTANSSGGWTFQPTGLGAGAHMVVASETNSVGTSTASLSFVLLPQSFTDGWTNASGGSWATAANWNNGVPGAVDVVSLPLSSGETVTVSSGTNSISQIVETGTGGTLAITAGSLSTAALSDIAGSLLIIGGVLNLGAPLGTLGLTQSGGLLNGTGTLTVSGLSAFSGGTESGSGTTIVSGGAAFTLTSFGLDGGRTLQLGGNSTAAGTQVQISLNATNPNTGVSDAGSGILTIASGATLTDQTTISGLNIITVNRSGDTGAAAAVNNAGTFIKSGNAATSTISTLFNNSGIVNVQSGTLILSGGGTDVGATYQGAGTVNFAGGTRTLDSTSNIQGNATFSGGQTTVNGGTGSGLLTFTGGTATFNDTVIAGALTQSGGELNGTGTLTATGGPSAFSGGTESGSGTTIVSGGAAFTLTSFGLDGGRTLQLGGNSTAAGTQVQISLNATNPNTGVSDAGSGILTIASGATLTDQTTISGLNIITVNRSGDTGAAAAVNNAGTFIKSGNAATSTISTLFNNSGIVNVQSGTLILSGGGTDVGATYQGAGTVNFAGGTRTLDSTSNIQGNATFSGGQTTVNGGTGSGLLTFTGGTATFNDTVIAGALTQSGGELNGTGTLTATGGPSAFSGGTESGSGTTIVSGGAAFTLTSFGLDGGRTLQLGGNSTAAGTQVQISLNATNPNTGVSDAGSGILTIASGATLTDQTTISGLNIITVNRSGDTGAAAAVNNAGTFIKSGNAATSTISTLFNNSGIVNVQSGTLILSGGGTT